ncbi:MAG TPA: family 16 glycoside hydrolase, partial [Candidatus Binatia bacterium]|nr:family 16 glycoside hydrolase [Candidatus Binatia bacterium]
MKTLLSLTTLLLVCSPLFAAETGFKKLFNGKDLTGWNGNPNLWSVKDGTIQGQTTKENPTKGNTFLIYTNGDVSDFELR